MQDETYPKFLARSPTFLGLELMDMGVITMALNLSLFLGLSSSVGACMALGIVAARRLLRDRVDLVGWRLGLRRPKALDWEEEIRRESL